MFKAKPMSREEARERRAQVFGLKFFGLLLCAMLLGAGLGYLLLLI